MNTPGATSAAPSPTPPVVGLPTHDWQFWVVTVAAALALAWLLWKQTPLRRALRRKPADAARKRVRLTISAPHHPTSEPPDAK